jgi:hypothetical protein
MYLPKGLTGRAPQDVVAVETTLMRGRSDERMRACTGASPIS